MSSVCCLPVGLVQAACGGAPSTSSRLTAKGGSVYDSETDLTWQRCSVGMKWVEAKGCIGVATRGTWKEANATPWKEGWRIPAPEELETILEKNCNNPSIDERVFPKTASDGYWTNRSDGTACWTVSFSDGRTTTSFCGANFAVRLVRAGKEF